MVLYPLSEENCGWMGYFVEKHREKIEKYTLLNDCIITSFHSYNTLFVKIPINGALFALLLYLDSGNHCWCFCCPLAKFLYALKVHTSSFAFFIHMCLSLYAYMTYVRVIQK